jgi:hypothetical protein
LRRYRLFILSVSRRVEEEWPFDAVNDEAATRTANEWRVAAQPSFGILIAELCDGTSQPLRHTERRPVNVCFNPFLPLRGCLLSTQS